MSGMIDRDVTYRADDHIERGVGPGIRRTSGVSIVIATYNRSATLQSTLARLCRLRDVEQVIVVDNGSTDDTVTAVRARFPFVRLIALQTNCGVGARTTGVEAATSEFVALCDDDCWYEEGALEHAASLLEAHPEVAVVNARVLVGRANVLDPACAAMQRGPSFQGDPRCHAIRAFMAGAATVRRSAFLEVGGFQPRYFFGGEELLTSLDFLDSGWFIVYAPRAVVHHHPSSAGRDASFRAQLVARNHLWTVWLRGRPRQVARYTRAALRAAVRDRGARIAFLHALGGLPWVITQRRTVGPAAAHALGRLLPLP